jgi:hypothetical protein
MSRAWVSPSHIVDIIAESTFDHVECCLKECVIYTVPIFCLLRTAACLAARLTRSFISTLSVSSSSSRNCTTYLSETPWKALRLAVSVPFVESCVSN